MGGFQFVARYRYTRLGYAGSGAGPIWSRMRLDWIGAELDLERIAHAIWIGPARSRLGRIDPERSRSTLQTALGRSGPTPILYRPGRADLSRDRSRALWTRSRSDPDPDILGSELGLIQSGAAPERFGPYPHIIIQSG